MISEINGSTEVPLTHPWGSRELWERWMCALSLMATYCELHCAPHQCPSLDSCAQVFLFRMSLRLCVQVDANPE